MTVLALTINGEPWSETEDLASSGPEDLHYVVDRDSGQISFGDGKHGAVPPTGATFDLRLSVGGGIAGHFYRIDVPHGGAVTLTTHPGSLEKPSESGHRAKRVGCLTTIVGAAAGLLAWRSRRRR